MQKTRRDTWIAQVCADTAGLSLLGTLGVSCGCCLMLPLAARIKTLGNQLSVWSVVCIYAGGWERGTEILEDQHPKSLGCAHIIHPSSSSPGQQVLGIQRWRSQPGFEEAGIVRGLEAMWLKHTACWHHQQEGPNW